MVYDFAVQSADLMFKLQILDHQHHPGQELVRDTNSDSPPELLDKVFVLVNL